MLKTICAYISAALVIACAAGNRSVFADVDGKKEVYLTSASSDCVISSEIPCGIVFGSFLLKGECVKGISESEAKKIIAETGAEKVFSEKVGCVISDYYYSKKIARFIYVYGRKVNLHVAKDGDYITVGSPVIFGSY